MIMKKIDLYTDGACSGNPGPGGWGAVLLYNKNEKQLSGYNKDTTNNRMEMFAVVMGLKELRESCDVTVFTDSAYVHNAFKNGWIDQWQKNNWRTKAKKEVKNIDLWKLLLTAMSRHRVDWVKVKGHSDNKYNNICDKLAVDEIKNAEKKKV
jgi:ribonuclease HI